MALRYGFFNSVNGDRKYSADDMMYPYKGIVSDGVLAHPQKSDGFQVVAGTGLQVKVNAGFGIFAGKWCENDSVVNMALSPAHVTLPRIDTVYIRVDLSESGRKIELLLNTGTPANSPVAMSFSQENTKKYFRLADIRVNANATTISQSNITDKRTSSECGIITNLLHDSDISATYAQWEDQFRRWFAGLQDEVIEETGKVDEAIENANSTIATLDTETREDFNEFLVESESKVNQSIETSQQEFDSWFSNVQQTLNQNTLMTGYFQKFIATEDNTAEVPINITAYTSVKDVLQVHINGMLAVPNVDYIVNDFTTITLSKPIDKDTVIMFTVFKTIDGSEAETIVEQVADLSSKVDRLMVGDESNYYTKVELEERLSQLEERLKELEENGGGVKPENLSPETIEMFWERIEEDSVAIDGISAETIEQLWEQIGEE